MSAGERCFKVGTTRMIQKCGSSSGCVVRQQSLHLVCHSCNCTCCDEVIAGGVQRCVRGGVRCALLYAVHREGQPGPALSAESSCIVSAALRICHCDRRKHQPLFYALPFRCMQRCLCVAMYALPSIGIQDTRDSLAWIFLNDLGVLDVSAATPAG